MPHKPVLLDEVLRYLELKPGAVVVDGTLGGGGHAEAMLAQIGSEGKLVGFDQDEEAIKRCQEKFAGEKRIQIIHSNFRGMNQVLKDLHISGADAVLLDVGISSFQIDTAERGFSFQKEGPLDMRMNFTEGDTAADLVNYLPAKELDRIFFEYGEERSARKVTRMICDRRTKKKFETTHDLAQSIEKILPRQGRLHPATRIFQGLRIAVNDELGALQEGMDAGFNFLNEGGKMAVISFHSLEDRLVKNFFRDKMRSREGFLINKKPITPTLDEVRENSRSRSAKLRVIEKRS
ncbi:MAG TPA: 16S rRNA (cytosine(1402)-N(4))-methyltransferase [Candidatus Omnitrophica bacterium]|nr:16S rRNA (cytosine(1402)-N(4))-methyltransferase [Candidatus Omnitrophota bacterium]